MLRGEAGGHREPVLVLGPGRIQHGHPAVGQHLRETGVQLFRRLGRPGRGRTDEPRRRPQVVDDDVDDALLERGLDDLPGRDTGVHRHPQPRATDRLGVDGHQDLVLGEVVSGEPDAAVRRRARRRRRAAGQRHEDERQGGDGRPGSAHDASLRCGREPG
jgi:hypothetical protein